MKGILKPMAWVAALVVALAVLGPYALKLVLRNSPQAQWWVIHSMGGPGSLIRTNMQTGTSYAVTEADGGSLIMFNGTRQNTLNLPSPADVPNGWYVFVHNAANGTIFLVPAAGTVEGERSWPLYTDEGVLLVSTGGLLYGYHAVRGTETNGRSNTPGTAVNAQHGTSYMVKQSDRNTVLMPSNDVDPVTITLPKPGVDYPNGWHFYVKNGGLKPVALSPTGATIDGLGALSLAAYQSAFVVSDGTNYFTGSSGMGAVANVSGMPQSGAHWVFGSCRLGTNCSVTLSGSAVFRSASSYVCTAVDQTSASPVRVAQTSGDAFVITGAAGDMVGYTCVGN